MNDLKHYLDTVERLFAQTQFAGQPTELYEPIEYTLRLGGKRLRPAMLLIGNAMYGGQDQAVFNAAIGIEVFHNFTLLHDDLMDQSPLRRGQPTVYRRWNANTAVLSGDTMFALAWRYFLKLETPRLQQVLNCFNETAIEVCEGQQHDMNFERRIDVSIDQYMAMIRQKTAVLLAAALKIGALCSTASDAEAEKLYTYGIHLGLAFQLQDDLLDCYGDTAVFGKKTGQDIRDNKKTYLPLRAAEMCSAEQRDKLRSLFATTTVNEEEKVQQVKAIYDAVGLCNVVEQAVDEQFSQANAILDTLHIDNTAKHTLQQLCSTLRNRKK